jgi:hypothetical protein
VHAEVACAREDKTTVIARNLKRTLQATYQMAKGLGVMLGTGTARDGNCPVHVQCGPRGRRRSMPVPFVAFDTKPTSSLAKAFFEDNLIDFTGSSFAHQRDIF